MSPTEPLGSAQVAALAGITLRQLQWWDERRIVVAIQKGHKRLYSRMQVAQIILISGLKRKGFSLQQLRRVRRQLFGALNLAILAINSSGIRQYVATDGRKVVGFSNLTESDKECFEGLGRAGVVYLTPHLRMLGLVADK